MARRASRFSRGRKKQNIFDIDITALLDVVIILLIFLLQNQESSGVIHNIPKVIDLPTSTSASTINYGINVQVSKTHIFVDNVEVVSTEIPDEQLFDEGGRRIVPLYNQLMKIKEKIKLSEKSSPDAIKFSGVANLIVDKSLKYNYLKRVMYTCAAAGFKDFKFLTSGSN